MFKVSPDCWHTAGGVILSHVPSFLQFLTETNLVQEIHSLLTNAGAEFPAAKHPLRQTQLPLAE